MPFKTISFALTGCLLVLLLPVSALSQTGCGEFPEVDFWGELSHALVRQNVEENFSGGWDKYIGKLKRKHLALSRINSRGKAARVSRAGRKVVMKGAGLSRYLKYSRQRIEVVECLAKAAGAGEKPKKQALSTPLKQSLPDKEQEIRTELNLSKNLLDKLHQEAIRRSQEENRKVSVNEIILETVKQDLKRPIR